MCILRQSSRSSQVYPYRRNQWKGKCLEDDIPDTQAIRKKSLSLYESTQYRYQRTIRDRGLTDFWVWFYIVCHSDHGVYWRTLLLWEMYAPRSALLLWYWLRIRHHGGGTMRTTRRDQHHHATRLDHHEYLIWSYGAPRQYTRGDRMRKMRHHQAINTRDTLWAQSNSRGNRQRTKCSNHIREKKKSDDQSPRRTSDIQCSYRLWGWDIALSCTRGNRTSSPRSRPPREAPVSQAQSPHRWGSQRGRDDGTQEISHSRRMKLEKYSILVQSQIWQIGESRPRYIPRDRLMEYSGFYRISCMWCTVTRRCSDTDLKECNYTDSSRDFCRSREASRYSLCRIRQSLYDGRVLGVKATVIKVSRTPLLRLPNL